MVTLLLIPLGVALMSLFLYRHNGKRQLFHMDLVQFTYSFIVYPAIFVWAKSFLLYIARNEIQRTFTVGELFIIDSILSVSLLYIYAFVIMHSLTKTMNLQRLRDPLYDLLHHVEYIHLYLSHIAFFFGFALLSLAVATLNIWFPLTLEWPKATVWLITLLGVIFGVLSFITAWISDPRQGHFMRIMKLLFGAGVVLLVALYFWREPRFSPVHAFYWCVFAAFSTSSILSMVFSRSRWLGRFLQRLTHDTWGKPTVQLFAPKGK